eukprot:6226736-Prymnesium_polylepis.2
MSKGQQKPARESQQRANRVAVVCGGVVRMVAAAASQHLERLGASVLERVAPKRGGRHWRRDARKWLERHRHRVLPG